jgi:hypothetical protein
MSSRARWIAITAASAVAAASCIAYTPARTFELRAATGRPIREAHVGYYHASSIFNFVD